MGLRKFTAGKARRIMAALSLACASSLSSTPAQAQTTNVPTAIVDDGAESALTPYVQTAATYGSLYVIVVASVQVAGGIIAAAAPASWSATAQTFGVPLLVVPLMAEMVPRIRRNVPPFVESWMGGSAPKE